MSFFDMFGPMFDPEGGSNRAGRQNPRKPSNDDPIILNVETDGGDGPQPSSNVPPKRPSGPRITSKPNRPRKPSNGSKIFIGVVLALAIVIGLFFALAQFVTDVMWYSQLGFQSVIWTQLGTRVGLWLAYAVLIAAVGFISATLAIWARPDAADGSTIRVNGDTIEIGKSVSSKSARRIAVVISLIVGLVFGSQFNANWSEILLMFNSQSFGTKDPQFGIDNGFYVFVLPGLKLIMSAVSLLLLAGIIFSIVTHVLMGGIRITMPVNGHGLFRITKRARRQIGIWLMLNMFAWAANQVLGVFSHLTEEGSRITGATYTTVNATIPVTFIMAAITAILGVILGLWIMKSHTLEGSAPIAARASEALKAWKVPTVAIASAIVVSLVLTVAWPVLLQRFRVNPNAQEMESTYIQRNIDATRAAYGLDKVKAEQYKATTEGEEGALADSAESTAQIRLLDPQIISPDVQTAAAVQAVLHVRRHRRGRQIRRRRRQPGHGDRRARTRSGRSRQPQLGQRPHRVHARLWRCGRLRQQGDRRRPAEVLRSGHPHPRQAHRFRKVRAAHLLLSERHRIFDRRRSGRHQILGITTIRPVRKAPPTPSRAMAVRRSATSSPDCCTPSASAPTRSCSPTV